MKARKKLYLIHIPDLNLQKIGIGRNPEERLKQLQTGCPYKLEALYSVDSKYPTRIEKALHKKFNHRKILDGGLNFLKGEWFNLDINEILKFTEICEELEGKIDFLKKEKNPFV